MRGASTTDEDGTVRRNSFRETLHATLKWCTTHLEPVWVYDDESYTCPFDTITESNSEDHVIVDAPWVRHAG